VSAAYSEGSPRPLNSRQQGTALRSLRIGLDALGSQAEALPRPVVFMRERWFGFASTVVGADGPWNSKVARTQPNLLYAYPAPAGRSARLSVGNQHMISVPSFNRRSPCQAG
jgi:hypothetical protein